MRMNRLVMGLAVGLLWLAGATAARADSQPITGTAYMSYLDSWEFHLTGPTLSAYTSLNGGPDTILVCDVGVPCDISQSQYGVVGLDTFGDNTRGGLTYQGNAAPEAVLNLIFSGPIVLPAPDPSDVSAGWGNIPITVSGEFFTYSSDGSTLLYSGSISGYGLFNGSGFYSDGAYNFLSTSYTYSGIADVTTPEPAPLLLLGTGLLGLLILACRRKSGLV